MDERTDRRRVLRSLGACATATLAGVAGCADVPGTDDGDGAGDPGGGAATDAATPTAGSPAGGPTEGLAVGVETVATGFASPVGVETPAGFDRQYVVDQPGVIHLVEGGDRRDRPFLDLRERVVDVSGYDERGLLGLAFHPSFADNGRFFVRYSAPRRSATPVSYSHTFVLAEFRVDPSARRTSLSAATERTLLEIPQPQANHNAGAVAFGPDGYLYVGVGDGGGANDIGRGHVDDWDDGVDGGNGQDVERNLLGSVLRLDVDERRSSPPQRQSEDVDAESGDRPYEIPDDNPLVGRAGLDEQYAWGFRNPWRLSFDRGDLYVADVGQNRYEEVNVVERGGNYGWNVREGAHCFRADVCPRRTPDDVRGGEPLVDPIVEYPHDGGEPSGVAVIGGYRYRGEAIPELRGRYVFADWDAGGALFAATEAETGRWPVAVVPVTADAASFGRYVLAFGRAPDDELFVLTSDGSDVGGETGALHRLVPSG